MKWCCKEILSLYLPRFCWNCFKRDTAWCNLSCKYQTRKCQNELHYSPNFPRFYCLLYCELPPRSVTTIGMQEVIIHCCKLLAWKVSKCIYVLKSMSIPVSKKQSCVFYLVNISIIFDEHNIIPRFPKVEHSFVCVKSGEFP